LLLPVASPKIQGTQKVLLSKEHNHYPKLY